MAEMYAVCAIRYVSRQMVPVEACDSAEGFVFEEGPATNSIYIYPESEDSRSSGCNIIASTTTAVFRFWCGRLGTAVTHVSSLRTLTRLAFVPAALIVPLSLQSEAGVLLHP